MNIRANRLTAGRVPRSMHGCGKQVLAMRCMACGEEMRVVQVVPDATMPVPGYEHHTLECPACHEVERRLIFIREMEPVPFEPRTLPPLAREDEVTASAGAAANPSVKTWARALDRLRVQQTSLQERKALAKASQAADEFRRDWDDIVRTRRPAPSPMSGPVKITTVAKIAKTPAPRSDAVTDADGARSHKEPSSAMARVIARLRRRGAWQAVDRSSETNRNFDRMWESFAPGAPLPEQSSVAALAILARSRSLVPIALPTDEAWSTWARAMTLLRAQQ
jgi:hypothetical protein